MTPIYTIQGTSHQSTFVGQTVTTTGVVTAIDSTGFYIQDAQGDGDNRTSDAIFVFTGSDATGSSVPAFVQIGDQLQVTGAVSEFIPGGSAVGARGGLSISQITASSAGSVVELGTGSVLATVIGGSGSCMPPAGQFGDASNTSFGPNDPLDPTAEATDFWESLEGMLVTVNGGRVVGPTNDFGEVFVVVDNDDNADNGLNTGDPVEPRGVLLVEGGGAALGDINPGDYNPERIQIDDDPTGRGGSLGVSQGFSIPRFDVGTVLNPVTGVVNYDFGSYEVLAVRPTGGQPAVTVAQASTLQRETTIIAGTATHMTVGTYNVENLDPFVELSGEIDDDVASGKFEAIATHIVDNMGAPDVIALQEVQDGNGGTNDNLVSAEATLQRLIKAISEAGVPTYAFVDNPFIGDDTSGGQPGGNIRNAFLYRVDRVDFVPGSLRTIDDDGNPYTTVSVDPVTGLFNGTAPVNAGTAALDDQEFQTNPFFASRLPLVADFRLKSTGEATTLINNHLSSKSNSGPLYGADPTPANGAELARNAQAQTVNTFLDGLLSADPHARAVVLGDLNDFEFEEPLTILEGRATYVDGSDADTNREFTAGGAQVLYNLINTAAANDRYSYVFEGNAQSLDHVLVTSRLRTDGTLFDSVHVNAEFGSQTSDHDPKVVSLNLARPSILGSAADETFEGTPFSDTVLAGAGNDVVRDSAGDDFYDGGTGIDTLVIAASLSDATLRSDGGTQFQIMRLSGAVDTFSNFERIQFNDRLIDAADENRLVDDIFYYSNNPDVLAAGVDADQHYTQFGAQEGRDPNSFFSTRGYLSANPDVAAAGVNPLVHYATFGAREGRDPSAVFDTTLYLRANPDVAAAGVNHLVHYLEFGAAEGRTIYEAVGLRGIVGGFDAEYYLLSNPDVGAAYVDPLNHYLLFGAGEGRDPNPYFDSDGYLARYTDVRDAGVNPLNHYILFGANEGRDPSREFDTRGYLANNPDVAAAGVNPLQHYLAFGIYEGRAVVNDGLFA
jgi:endonuclease/exonuclease/phosphatase family metal-dependent hydrolase